MTERMCIVTRAVRPVEEMIRFVLGPDDQVVPDIACKLPGRGVWIAAEAGSVDQAVRKNLFARGFKQSAGAGGELVTLVAELLQRRALGLLSLAQKAGLVRCGFEKTVEVAKSGKLAILVSAADGSADGARKLRSKIVAARRGAAMVPVVSCFDGHDLSLALGRENVVHAAVSAGPLADEFHAAAQKFETYRDAAGMAASQSTSGPAGVHGKLEA